MKDSRKIEDIILPFVTTATKSLKDDNQLAEGAWKVELNTQIQLFLQLIGDALHACGGGGELMVRLESYMQRMKDDAPAQVHTDAQAQQSTGMVQQGSTSAGTSDAGHGEEAGTRGYSAVSNTSIKGKGTDHVWRLFGMHEDQLVGKLREMEGVCTEVAALEDLKVSLNAVQKGHPWTKCGCRDRTAPSSAASDGYHVHTAVLRGVP
jgi:hypothetical protein